MVDFIRRLLSLEGVGTELGVANLLLLTALVAVAGYVVKWKWAEIRTLVEEHRAMYKDYVYQKKRDESKELRRSRAQMKADRVSALMREKESNDE